MPGSIVALALATLALGFGGCVGLGTASSELEGQPWIHIECYLLASVAERAWFGYF